MCRRTSGKDLDNDLDTEALAGRLTSLSVVLSGVSVLASLGLIADLWTVEEHVSWYLGG